MYTYAPWKLHFNESILHNVSVFSIHLFSKHTENMWPLQNYLCMSHFLCVSLSATFSSTFRQQLSSKAASLPLTQWKELWLVRGSYVDEKVRYET